MGTSISNLLKLFLDLYERDPTTLSFFLEEPNPFGLLDSLNSQVSLKSQYDLLLHGYQEVQQELLAKTLLKASGFQSRHRSLGDELSEAPSSQNREAPYEPLHDQRLDADELEMFRRSGVSRETLIETLHAFMANKQGLTADQYTAKILEKVTRERLADKRIDSEVIRFFADRVDGIISAIEQLDNTRFDLLIPEKLYAPFRELHMNAALGNFGSACILCGTLLERALQDLLPSRSMLNELIKEAKTEGLLQGSYRSYADRIRDDRNNAAHGTVAFGDISSDRAWETVTCTRKLISALYKDRLSQE